MIRRVLVPWDHSQRAKAILPLATAIAQAAYAEVILLSVAPEKAWFDHYIGADAEDVAGVCETYLSHLVQILADRSVPARHVLLRGDPARQIVQFAKSNDVDLIAMATHGRHAVDRWSSGSVADTVIRTSSVPVLLSRAPAADLERDVALRQRILIPLDGSPHSETCIPYALEFASLSSVHLIFLHVIDDSHATEADPQTPGEQDDLEFLTAVAEWQSQSSHAYLRSVVERCVPLGMRTSHYVRFGSVAKKIVEVADEERVDLIAIATHARSGLKRFVMGSVATQVLQESQVPLLLVSGAAVKRRSESNQCERTRQAVEVL